MSPTSCQTAPPRTELRSVAGTPSHGKPASNDGVEQTSPFSARSARGDDERAVAPVEQRTPRDAEREQCEAVQRQRPAEAAIARQLERGRVVRLVEVHDLDHAQV